MWERPRWMFPTRGFKQRYSEVFGMQLRNISGVYRAHTLVLHVCDSLPLSGGFSLLRP